MSRPAGASMRMSAMAVPGRAEEFRIELATPGGPAAADLVLTCERAGKEVFRDVKPVRVRGREPDGR